MKDTSIDAKNLTIIIPAFNEEKGIAVTLQQLRAQYPEIHIIVVDDGSSDETANVASRFDQVKVISHHVNRGYGAALKTGMRNAETKYVLWYDADGQHQSEDIANIVLPVQNGDCDACFGVRGKDSANVAKRAPGKFILRMTSQIVARRNIPDLNCGLRCFRSEVIKRYLHLLPDGFSASSTSTLLMIKRGYRVKFCRIRTMERIGKSTVRMWRDGIFTLKLILRIMMLFDAFLFFSVIALLQLVPGVIYTLYIVVVNNHGVPVMGALVLISGFLTFSIGLISAQISEMRQEQFEYRARNLD